MKNIVIAAGYATRLYPLTKNFGQASRRHRQDGRHRRAYNSNQP